LKPLLAYAAVAAGLLLLAVAGLGLVLGPEAQSALWAAAGGAFMVQVLAFALLQAAGRRTRPFFAAWGGGMALRLLVVSGAAWLAWRGYFAPVPLLIGLVGFLFVLLLLEPVFLRLGMQKR
jgi:hypothetical protein